jgi:hypothetical protein
MFTTENVSLLWFKTVQHNSFPLSVPLHEMSFSITVLVTSPVTLALSHKNPASAEISGDSYASQEHSNTDTLLAHA